MLRHLLTLIWNRKRANFLLLTEIFFAFIVLFVIGSMLIYNQVNYRLPRGFEYENGWEMTLNPAGQAREQQHTALLQVIQRLRTLPGVVDVARHSSNTPFSFSNMNTIFPHNGKDTPLTEIYEVDDHAANVLGLKMLEGRWFDRRDDAVGSAKPIIVTKDFRDAVFPNGKAVGEVMVRDNEKLRIIGVTTTYRPANDYADGSPGMFMRTTDLDSVNFGLPVLVVRVQPGSDATLQERVSREIATITGGWKTDIQPLPEKRIRKLKTVLVPIVGLSLVGVFLILNVALGLFGVLWVNISQRRAEIGLRRAMGATGSAISWQFLTEMLLLTTLGVVLGSLVAMQFPLLGVLGVPSVTYVLGMGAAAVLIYLITAVCAFQPSRQAAGIHPAVALREE
ncbi:ABC transporter permease [Hymenobacter sp. 102]|uniref:ABC transporter permease n=1 Tax=Hymenobacter sp. 102 TaxID=3403152 RepID=UPI003CF59C2E